FATNRSAMARPIPRFAPVTTTVRGAGAVASDTVRLLGTVGWVGGRGRVPHGRCRVGLARARDRPARTRRTDRTVPWRRRARCGTVTALPHTLWGPDKRRLAV